MTFMKKVLALLITLLITSLGDFSLSLVTYAKAKYSSPLKTKIKDFNWLELQNQELLKINLGFPSEKWWEAFDDPFLNQLINRAILNNPDYLMAQARIKQAKYLRKKFLAQEFPRIGLGANFTRQKNSENLSTIPIDRLGKNGVQVFSPGETLDIYRTPLSFDYELDLFSKKRLLTKKAKVLNLKSVFESRKVLTDLTSEVAVTYFSFLESESQIQLLQALIKLDLVSIKLHEALFTAGLLSEDKVNNQKKIFDQNQLELSNTLKNKRSFFYKLSYLIGEIPNQLDLTVSKKLEEVRLPNFLSISLPSELLLRRADILAAEQNLKANEIQVSASRRAFFPSFNFSLQGGFSSINLGNLVSPESLLLGLTGGLVQAVFSGGERRADLNLARAKKIEALCYYQQVILKSFQEVENALNSHKANLKNNIYLEQQLKLQNDNLALLKSRYKQGLIPYQEVIFEKKKKIILEQSVRKNYLQKLASVIALYKALGA